MPQNLGRKACPLCERPAGAGFHSDGIRDYFRCQNCGLAFVAPDRFLSHEDEKARYDLHENSPDDQGYRRFLNRLFIPMLERIEPQSHGLDFGSGPGPTLSVMFEETGRPMDIYDHFFAREPSVFKKKYDFITATEVVEHLHNPGKELTRLWACLKPGGWLGIMTKLAQAQEAFSRWHYKDDPTHVCFFSKQSFEWLAGEWGAGLTFSGNDVILFCKNSLD